MAQENVGAPRRARQRLALVAPVRTPIGKFGGGLAGLSAADLGTHVAQACLRRAGVEAAVVDQVILGHARQAPAVQGGGPGLGPQGAEGGRDRLQAGAGARRWRQLPSSIHTVSTDNATTIQNSVLLIRPMEVR